MKSKSYTPKQYLDKFEEFLKALNSCPLSAARIGQRPEQIADLFRFWWMDFREQEATQEARDSEENWGIDPLMGDD